MGKTRVGRAGLDAVRAAELALGARGVGRQAMGASGPRKGAGGADGVRVCGVRGGLAESGRGGGANAGGGAGGRVPAFQAVNISSRAAIRRRT